MKINTLLFCFILSSGSIGCFAAAPQAKPAGPTGQQPPAAQPSSPASKSTMPPFYRGPRPTALSTVFTSPGIATLQGGSWLGSEHLYNLPSDLGVVVEVIKPPTASVQIAEDKIKGIVSAALKTVYMRTREPIIEKDTPLPFLHVLIIIHPIEKGFVAYCAIRLFEETQMKRIFLKSGIVWQVITWEKQELVITPPDQLSQQIEQTIQSIMTSFTDRIKNYALENLPGATKGQ